MIALSTSWKDGDFQNAGEFFKALEPFQPVGIELEYRIREPLYHQIRPSLRPAGIRVVSVHNYFPHPAGLAKLRPSGDLFSLASPDAEERGLALKYTTRTIETAHDLEAGAVVLHCGYVPLDMDTGAVKRFFRRGEMDSLPARQYLAQLTETLGRKKGKYLDSLLFSLDRLVRVAQRANVRLGLENRYHFHELPGFEDFGIIFREFAGGPLGYWHDTGHAHAQEALLSVPQGKWLAAFGEHLIGAHLHDARGIDDHLPPGEGEIDFAGLLPSLKGCPWVLELKAGTPAAEVQQGLVRLREMAAQA